MGLRVGGELMRLPDKTGRRAAAGLLTGLVAAGSVAVAAAGPASEGPSAPRATPVTARPATSEVVALASTRAVTVVLDPIQRATTTTTAPPPPPPPPTTAPPPPPPPPAASGSVEDAIRTYFPDVYGSALAVADCESSLNPNAVSAGGGNHGLFQINNVHKGLVESMGYSWSQIYDPYVNSAVARHLYDESGWSPWACAWAA